MTTAREIKKIVAPIIDRNPDLSLIGRVLIIKPVHHVLRGVVFNRTSDADCFEIVLSIMILFNRHDDFNLLMGGDIYPPRKGLWLMSNKNIADDVCAKIEQEALPRLRNIGSDFEYTRSWREGVSHGLNRAASGYALCRIAEGNLDAARDLIATSEFASYVWLPHLKRLGLDEKLLALGNKLPHEDRLTLAGLLHEWEAYSVEKLKLGKIWERTPFPLETMPS
ncbi:MAG TPA: hypothetical protein PLK13_05835 [Xanthobacteraceae bacterium]|uniref:hypothetical protein n=1 Tax=Roseixanthobacter finlandensis TaxID=3119922 RepID=UPI002BC5B5D4|nr:hypothetical protein [Xanthobacteraceae bacterium]